MDELSIKDVDLYEQLLDYGFFPEYTPTCFNTKGLSRHFNAIKSSVSNQWSKPLTFTISKRDLNRRLIKIPNIEQHLKLVECIMENLDDIKTILNENTHSLSNPIYTKEFNYENFIELFDIPKLKNNFKIRSTFIDNLSNKLRKSMGYKFVFKLDISNFYDSIYTHAIEWAVIGIENSKIRITDRNHMSNNIGKYLDTYVRNTNFGETSGIPTGPFTSRIISEIILVEINKNLYELFKSSKLDVEFIHYVDDYEFYFRSEADFKSIKQSIIKCFHDFHLRINENKTDFLRYPYHSNINPGQEYNYLKEKYFKNNDPNTLRDLFFKSDDLYNKGSKGAYSYLYKMINKYDFKDNWSVLEPFIIGHLLFQPNLAHYIITLIQTHITYLSEEFKSELFYNLQKCLEQNLHNEIQWIFLILTKIKYVFTVDNLMTLLTKADDDLFRIMLISYINNHNRYKKSIKINTYLKDLANNLKSSSPHTERWLLIYEWYYNEWKYYDLLKDVFRSSNCFNTLRKRKINFFDELV